MCSPSASTGTGGHPCTFCLLQGSSLPHRSPLPRRCRWNQALNNGEGGNAKVPNSAQFGEGFTDAQGRKWELKSLAGHQGGGTGGHYVAYVKRTVVEGEDAAWCAATHTASRAPTAAPVFLAPLKDAASAQVHDQRHPGGAAAFVRHHAQPWCP